MVMAVANRAHWNATKLGSLVARRNARRGKQPEPEVLTCSKDAGLIPQREKFSRRLASKDTSRYKLVEPGDFVYDANLLWSGSIVRNELGYGGIVSPVYEVFRVSSPVVDPEFLSLWLKHWRRLEDYAAISTGTNVRRRKAAFEDFAQLDVVLPSIPEQQRIVTVVSAADDVRRALIEEERTLKALLRAGHLAAFESLSDKPRRLADITKVVAGGTPSRDHPEYFGGDVFWVKSGDIIFRDIYETPETITADAVESSAAKLLPPKTIVVAMYGQGATRGRCAVIQDEMATNQACAGILPSPGHDERFIFHWLWSQYEALREDSEGTSQPNLSKGVIEGLEIPLPRFDQQKDIAMRLDAILDRLIEVQEELKRAEKLQTVLVDVLLAGERRVNDRADISHKQMRV